MIIDPQYLMYHGLVRPLREGGGERGRGREIMGEGAMWCGT